MILSFAQGRLASCQTLAAIGAISLKPSGEALLRKLVTADGNGFSVKFPGSEEPVKITAADIHSHDFLTDSCLHAVGGDLENLCAAECKAFFATVAPPRYRHVSGDFLVRILELAYAKYQKRLHPDLFRDIADENVLEIYNQPTFHYRADISIHDLTGLNVETLHASGTVDDSSRSFAQEFAINAKLKDQVLTKLKIFSETPDAYVATVCTYGMPKTPSYHDPGMKVGPWHDHILENVDRTNQRIHVVDPYNSRVTLVLRYDDFFNYFYLLCWARFQLETSTD